MAVNPGFALSSGGGTSAVYLDGTSGTVWVKTDPDSTLGAIRTALPSGTNDLGNIIRVKNLVDGTLSTVTTVGAVTNITNSVAVHIGSTGGTMGVRVGQIDGSVAVYFSPANPAVAATFSGSIAAVPTSGSGSALYDETLDAVRITPSTTGTMAVYFSPANPSVAATFSGSIAAVPTSGSGSTLYDETADAVRVLISGSHTAASLTINGSLTGITNSISTYVSGTAGTLGVRVGQVDGTVAVYFSPSNPAVAATFSGSIAAVPTSGSGSTLYDETADAVRVLISGSHTASSLQIATGAADIGNLVRVKNVVDGTLTTVTTVGAVTNITNSISVYLSGTAGTLRVKIDPSSAGLATDDAAFNVASGTGSPMMALFDDTAPDSVDEGDAGIVRMTGNRIQMSHLDTTASLFTVSGSTAGISVSGVTLVAPSANASFKVYAYSIQTTGAVSLTAKFTNGAGTGPTEFWRPLVTASGVTGAQGANLTSYPSAPLFATGASTTLALVLDTATLVHYSVAYTKESA